MEGKNWSEFQKYKYKLENRCNKLSIIWKKHFQKKQRANKKT